MWPSKSSILIVDDEKQICDLLEESLTSQEYKCTIASNGKDALAAIAKQNFDIALLDIILPEISGLDILRSVREEHRNIVAIMITAVSDVNIAVEAMKLGAADYIIKPFSLDSVDICLHRILDDMVASKVSAAFHDTVEFNDKNHNRNLYNSAQLEAIARGVEANIDSIYKHSEMVTERTIGVAMNLGIPTREIKEWAKRRVAFISSRDKYFESILNRLNKSPLLQMVMGQFESYDYEIEEGERQN
ncbi:MAG: response regulator [Dehalococcoidales bacterium]|jgi:YesN/AraC family two-component response regulator